MSIIKCKMCGGDLAFEEGSTVCECEYCGSKQTLPNADSEKKVNLYNRANRLRRNNEFDKAASVYESIVAEFPEEAEAYWGLCLCAYGIEYVDDPVTGNKIPTCHRTMTESIMEDSNFEQACDNADVIARRVYRDEAKVIDKIQKNILSIAANEAPYDVFICYKETNDAGSRTEDSVLGQEIYDALTAKNLKVFFSRITLEDKLGVQYEPYIYAALSSAKVMLAIGTDFEYYDAVWVKNEWSRFLGMMKTDKTKILIPCYKGIDAYDIPKEFKGLQAQDMGKLGWLQDLTRGVEKLCGKGSDTQPATVVQQVVTASANIEPLLKRARMFLEDGNWKEAGEYCEKVLDQAPENAQAYLYKLMAELKVGVTEELKNCQTAFDNNNNYKKIMRFGDTVLKEKLEADNQFIIERNNKAKLTKCLLKCLNEVCKNYNQTLKKMNSAVTKEDYLEAAESFHKLNGLSDSLLLEQQCREKAIDCDKRILEDTEEALKLADVFIALEESKLVVELQKKEDDLKLFTTQLSTINSEMSFIQQKLKELQDRAGRYRLEVSQLRNKREKLGIFSTREKKLTDAKIVTLEENLLLNSAEIDEYEKNQAKCRVKLDEYFFSEREQKKQIHDLEQRIEEERKDLLKGVSFEETTRKFRKLACSAKVRKEVVENYPKIKDVEAVRNIMAEAGDVILFGNYNGNTEWIVLDRQDNKLFLLSKYAIETKEYNERFKYISWGSCTIREWLNATYILSAFNSVERKNILSKLIERKEDQIFLLSEDEVKEYFASESERILTFIDGTATDWWLRDWGEYSAAQVTQQGRIISIFGYGGRYVNERAAVRPAMWIDISDEN